MKKILVTLCVIGLAISLSAEKKIQKKIRIDFLGMLKNKKSKVKLTDFKLPPKIKKTMANWNKDPEVNKYYYIVQIPVSEKKWELITISFTPDNDGIGQMCLRANYITKGKKRLPLWVMYDNFKVTGTEFKNPDFEELKKGKTIKSNGGNIAHWWVNEMNIVNDKAKVKSGKVCIKVWHDKAIYRYLNLKKGKKVTMSFWAKAIK